MTFLYAAPRRLAVMALALLSLLTLWSVACGDESAEQGAPGTIIHKAINPDNLYPRSLDEMISRSGVIVRRLPSLGHGGNGGTFQQLVRFTGLPAGAEVEVHRP